ncbi:hypothetical protein WJX77_010396 [Trebouxia sp. C0004]
MSLLQGIKALARPQSSSGRSFWLADDRVKVCYECDVPFNLLTRRHHCRACGRIFCAHCTTSCVLEQGEAPERVCNFCYRLHVQTENSAREAASRTRQTRAQTRLSSPVAQPLYTTITAGPSRPPPYLVTPAPKPNDEGNTQSQLVRTGTHRGMKGHRDPALTWGIPQPLKNFNAGPQNQDHEHQQISSDMEGTVGSSPTQAQRPSPTAQQGFANVAKKHLAAVVGQVLLAEGCKDVSLWQPIITRLALDAAHAVLPSALAAFGVSDPRFYIKVKRVADVGEPADSRLVDGLVFRKNVVHKLMRTQIVQPRIMMLGSMLEYHRTTGKLSSFDTLLEQEHEHLRITVERVADYKPDVLLVEKSVARYAQELLLQKGISVVLNVKRSLLNRLARCTEAQIASSVEDLNNHCIAFCKEFRVEVLKPSRKVQHTDSGSSTPSTPLRLLRRSGSSQGSGGSSKYGGGTGPRTLMFFKGCPRPLGCTVLLQGADAEQLTLLKKVMKFAIYAAFAGRLEAAFLTDELASASAVLQGTALPPKSPFSNFTTATAPDISTGQHSRLSSDELSADSPTVEESGVLVKASDPDECSQAVAAESAESTAHVRLHNPILSFSPHVSHLVANYSHLQSASAQAGHHSLLGKTAGMSKQRSSSIPASLVHPAVTHAPQAIMPSPSASALASSPVAVQGHQHSSLGHGHARAQRQLFSSLSDPVAPPRLAHDVAQHPDNAHLLGHTSSGAYKADQVEAVEAESHPPSLAEVYSRQRLFVCKMCRNPARGLLCEPSSVQRIDYYQGNDMPLASFLAATAPQKCPNVTCGDGVTAHLRTFLHNRGRMTLSVSQLPGGKELPGSDKGQVWFWARPLQVEAAQMQEVRRVLLSPDALCLSLGHFLELSFGAPRLRIQGRSLHGSFVRYFGTGNTILCFHHEEICPNTVLVPARCLRVQRDVQHSWLHQELEEFAQEAAAAFSVLQAALHRQLSDAMPGVEQATAGGLQIASSVTDLLKAAEEERGAFDSMLRDVASLLTPDADAWLQPGAALSGPGAEADPKADRSPPHATLRVPNYVKMLWEIGRLRRSLAVLVMTWAATLHDPVVYARPISHSHSVPNSLRSLQDSEGHGRQLSTDSLPDLTRDDAPLQVVNRHAAVEEAELAQQALQADDTQASSVASSENDSVDNRHTSSAEGPQDENADQGEPEIEPLTVDEQASSTAVSSTPPPALPGGIMAQTILNLERQGQRSTPTRMNAAAAARRFVASALEQRARTLQWLNTSRLSADETLLRVGRPISQLAYVEVHLHVHQSGYVKCALIRVSQHSKALQALGLQDSSPSKPGPDGADPQPVAEPKLEHLEGVTIESVFQKGAADAHAAATADAASGTNAGAAGVGAEGVTSAVHGHDVVPEEPNMLSSSKHVGDRHATGGDAAAMSGSVSQPPAGAATDLSPTAAKGRAVFRHQRVDSDVAASEGRHPPARSLADWQEVQTEVTEPISRAISAVAPAQRGLSDASALISHFDDWANVLDSHGVESSLSRRGSGKLEGVEPDALRNTVDGLLKRQPAPSKLQPHVPSPAGIPNSMQSSSSLSQQQMSQIISAGGASYKQAQLQPNTIPLSHGKVELRSRALLAIGAGDIVVPIFDDEPTSIIAYALSSKLYQTHLKDSREKVRHKAAAAKQVANQPNKGGSGREAGLKAAIMAPLSPNLASFSNKAGSAHRVDLPGSRAEAQPAAMLSTAARAQAGDVVKSEPSQNSMTGSRWGLTHSSAADNPNSPRGAISGIGSSEAGKETERGGVEGPGSGASDMQVLLSEERMDFQHVFEDSAPGMAWARVSFQVTAYYAPQFEALRSVVVEGGEAVFIACLSRCNKWLSRGGKSAVYFAKTRDERYVVKQLTRSEKQSFLDFAPAYFRYLSGALQKEQDTCLAKVLGLYQVSKKNIGSAAAGAVSSGKDSVMDVLVMENVLYAANTTRIYDLKGSERSRWSQEDPTQAGAVLMDDNLRENNLTQPILVDQAAHANLEAVLWRDTAFLAGLGVMDYSLLVGLDSHTHRLVIGIIDFIRQYTWDKQLETWVKSSVMLGGARKEPTVISPKQYCRRFRVAISSYFVSVPSSEQALPCLDPDALM